MSFLTTGVSQTGLSRAGRCGPCVRWASSTAYLQRWPSATPYTPALLSIASVHPGKTGCSPLCDPSLGLEGGREGAEWVLAEKLIASRLVCLFVPEDHYFQILLFKSNPCLLRFISNIKKALKNLKTNTETKIRILQITFGPMQQETHLSPRQISLNGTIKDIISYRIWMLGKKYIDNLKIISFSKLGPLMISFVHS